MAISLKDLTLDLSNQALPVANFGHGVVMQTERPAVRRIYRRTLLACVIASTEACSRDASPTLPTCPFVFADHKHVLTGRSPARSVLEPEGTKITDGSRCHRSPARISRWSLPFLGMSMKEVETMHSGRRQTWTGAGLSAWTVLIPRLCATLYMLTKSRPRARPLKRPR